MGLFDSEVSVTRQDAAPIPQSEVDYALAAQLIVAWAGESGDEDRRLGWWRSDLVSEFGGEALFQSLLPNSWEWAVYQGVREVARRRDAERRNEDHNPDQILSLFHLGFLFDERIDERLQDLKRAAKAPWVVFPLLAEVIGEGWNQVRFIEWVRSCGDVETTTTPAGRRLKGKAPESLKSLVMYLVGGLNPLADKYPLPHYRKDK